MSRWIVACAVVGSLLLIVGCAGTVKTLDGQNLPRKEAAKPELRHKFRDGDRHTNIRAEVVNVDGMMVAFDTEKVLYLQPGIHTVRIGLIEWARGGGWAPAALNLSGSSHGLYVTLEPNQTYRPGCKIESGSFSVWLENNATGKKQTEEF
jgi:hypothetical protein